MQTSDPSCGPNRPHIPSSSNHVKKQPKDKIEQRAKLPQRNRQTHLQETAKDKPKARPRDRQKTSSPPVKRYLVNQKHPRKRE
ncbi:hypothetical protein, partial [Pararhodobacter sp. SW119]|uniref:hypothetical protein n=1 Tax=Pararhodobacter sp. SW119 TaxID=2780075 RepID=UPI001AE0BE22